MGSWLRCALACVVVLASQAPAPHVTPAKALSTYRELVDGYRRLDADTLRQLAALPDDTIAGIVESIRGDSPGWPPEDLHAAAMLHTDTGLELIKAGHLERGVSHFNAAARCIDRTSELSPAHRSFGRRWYAMATAMLQAYGAPAWAEEFAKRERARATPSAASHLLSEALREELEAAKDRPTTRGSFVGLINGVDARVARRYAAIARLFENVVEADPASHEAWLHLGRTLMLAGQDRDAVAALRRASDAADPRHAYLAALFLGAIDERNERFEDAERSYRRAMSIYPRGQSAPIALSHLLSRTSREGDAREALARHHARNRFIVIDPLWTYLLGTDEHLAAALNELRAEVWR
jgi:tetratricopeptide (TPR) repeat protein